MFSSLDSSSVSTQINPTGSNRRVFPLKWDGSGFALKRLPLFLRKIIENVNHFQCETKTQSKNKHLFANSDCYLLWGEKFPTPPNSPSGFSGVVPSLLHMHHVSLSEKLWLHFNKNLFKLDIWMFWITQFVYFPRHIRKLKRCKVPTQTFIERSKVKLLNKICNGNGWNRQGNLCTSNSKIPVFVVKVKTSDCTILNDPRKTEELLTVACDKVGKRCLPVHFQAQRQTQKRRKVTCSPAAAGDDDWSDEQFNISIRIGWKNTVKMRLCCCS